MGILYIVRSWPNNADRRPKKKEKKKGQPSLADSSDIPLQVSHVPNIEQWQQVLYLMALSASLRQAFVLLLVGKFRTDNEELMTQRG